MAPEGAERPNRERRLIRCWPKYSRQVTTCRATEGEAKNWSFFVADVSQMRYINLMAKDAMIRARIEESTKDKVERIFKKIGLSTTEAINLFYHQVLLHKGLPFDVKIPNSTTLQTFKDTEAGRNLKRAKSVQELRKKLGS